MTKQKDWKDLLVYFVGDLSKKSVVLHFSGLVIVLKANVSFFCCPSNVASRKNYGVEEQTVIATKFQTVLQLNNAFLISNCLATKQCIFKINDKLKTKF